MRITKNNIDDVYKSQPATIDHMERLGYTLIEELFVDASGFGLDSEPALTQSQLKSKLTLLLDKYPSVNTKLTNIGQFQVYIGLFIKTGQARSKRGSNRDVANAYAHNRVMHSLHMYIDNGAIYSYGDHFPIAYRTGKYSNGQEIALINSDSYSVTTNRHQHEVKRALNNCAFINIPTYELKEYIHADRSSDLLNGTIRSTIIAKLENTIHEFEGKAKRARKEWNKEYYMSQVARYTKQIQLFKDVVIPLHPKHV